jgi:hypothetical protein
MALTIFWGHSSVDDVQETNELLMVMALHTLTGDVAFENVA